MEVWRIAKWSEVFETAQSREYKSLPWVSMPTDMHSNGYQDLVDQFGAEALVIYGAWTAFVSVAAKCPKRGTLATSKGQPYSLTRIIREAYLHPDTLPVFEKLVAWASSEAIGWIVDATTEYQSGDSQATTDQQSGQGPSTVPNLTDNQSIRSIDRAMVFSGKEIGEDEWKDLQPKLTSTRKAIQPDERRKLKDADRELLIAAAVIEKRAGVVLIDPILKSMKDTRPEKPFPYFRTSFINACDKLGFDGRQALLSVPIPPPPQAQPP